MSALPSRQRPRRHPRPKPHWSVSRPFDLRQRTRNIPRALARTEGPAVMIPILRSFQRWQRQHHKHLKLIASETSPTDHTGKPQLPRRWSVTSTGSDLIDVATTVILSSEVQARQNIYRATLRQRELLPPGQVRRVKDPTLSTATKAAIGNPESPLLKHPAKLDSKAPASAANKVTELRTVITPA
jgi:hypothetical protein